MSKAKDAYRGVRNRAGLVGQMIAGAAAEAHTLLVHDYDGMHPTLIPDEFVEAVSKLKQAHTLYQKWLDARPAVAK